MANVDGTSERTENGFVPQSQSSPLRIIIVGAGIAGLTVARALRAPGHEILILEQSQLKRELGAAITIGPNASGILLPLGLDVKASHAIECHGYRIYDSNGEPKVVQDVNSRELFGSPWLLFHRVDLHTELRRLATEVDLPGPTPTLRAGVKVNSADVESGKLILEGGESIEGDVIIGADGIRSTLRDAVLGPDHTASATGHAMYRCLIPAADVMADPALAKMLGSSHLYLFVGLDRRIVCYWCHDKELLNVACVLSENRLAGATDGYQGIGDVEEMVSYFEDFVDPLPKLLRLATSCGIWKLHALEPVDTWVKGRTILVGDAAHAMLPNQGQGAGQAIEDAEALGFYLTHVTSSSQASEIPAILKQVQDVRIARATSLQIQSHQAANHRWNAPNFSPQGTDGTPEDREKPDPNYGLSNFQYRGAKEWALEHGATLPVSVH